MAIELGAELAEDVVVRRLAGARDDHVARNGELAARDRLSAAASARIRRSQPGALEDHAVHVAIRIGEDLDRRGEVLELHAFEPGLVLLLLVDDHLLRPAPVEDRRGLRAEAQRGSARVHRGVAATDDDDVLPDPLRLPEVRPLQEVDAVDHPVELLARDVHRDGVHAAGRRDDRVVAIAKLLEGDVAADLDVVVELHAVLGDPVDVELDDVARQPEGRDADQRRAPAGRERVVDMHLVTPPGELLGGGQAGGPGADHRHAATAGRSDDDVVRHVVAVVPVDQEALHRADRERLVDVGAAAGLLAGRRAHVAADGRDRIRVASEDVALLEAPFGGQHEVAAAVRVDRAAFLALDIALKPVDTDLGSLEPQWNRGIADHGVVVALSGRR